MWKDPPLWKETSAQVSTHLDHTENHTRGENGPPTVLGVNVKSKEIMEMEQYSSEKHTRQHSARQNHLLKDTFILSGLKNTPKVQ